MIAEELKRFPVVAALAEAEPEALVGGKFDRGELTLEIASNQIVDVCAYLKNEQWHPRHQDEAPSGVD